MGKGVVCGDNAAGCSAKARLVFATIAGAVLTMDASSFAIIMATMDKMTFLVDKLPEGVTSVE